MREELESYIRYLEDGNATSQAYLDNYSDVFSGTLIEKTEYLIENTEVIINKLKSILEEKEGK